MQALKFLPKENIFDFFKDIRFKNNTNPVVEQSHGFITPNADIIYAGDNNPSHHDLACKFVNEISDESVMSRVNQALNDSGDTGWEYNEFYSSILKDRGYIAYRIYGGTSDSMYSKCRASIKYYKKPSRSQIESLELWMICMKKFIETYSVNVITTPSYNEAIEVLYNNPFTHKTYQREYSNWCDFISKYQHEIDQIWPKNRFKGF